MSEKAVIGIIGCGAIARSVHLDNAFTNPRIDVKWCCDLFEDNLNYVKANYSPKHMTHNSNDVINDPEVKGVMILTNHEYRLELIQAAAKAGKHIYVEKPMSTTIAEAKEIVKAVREGGVKLAVGYNRRCAPIITDAKRIYKQNLECPCDVPWRYKRNSGDEPEFRESKATQILMRINDDSASFKKYALSGDNGTLVGEICHFADLACFILEKEPVKVYAEGWARGNMTVVLTFEDQSVCTIFDSCNGSFDHPKELIEIYSNGMSMQLDHYLQLRVGGRDDVSKINYPFNYDPYPEITEGEGTNLYINKVLERNKRVKKPDDFEFPGVDKGHYNMLDKFVDCVLYNAESPADEGAGARAALIITKAMQSIRSGLPMKIAEDEYTYFF